MIAQHGTLEISRSRLRNNLELLRRQIPQGTNICATVKADAYGHGVSVMAELLHEAGVEWVCVYTLEEAMELAGVRWFGILVLAPFVVMEGAEISREMLDALRGQIRLNVTDVDSAVRLADALANAGIEEPVNVHVQVDTGLTRNGAEPAEVGRLVAAIEKLPQLRLEGLFAHLSHGDVRGHASLTEQSALFHRAVDSIKAQRPHLMLHLQNSGGAFNLREESLELVRVGITLYGLQPSVAEPIAGLLPIARVTAPILAIHDRPVNTGVGYGHTFMTERATRVAIVPVGYADGYPRGLGNRCVAQVCGSDVPVVGRVSMDQIILDVTDVEGAKVGDVVTVVSWEAGRTNSLDEMARAMGTIGYELATHLGSRLKRVVVD